VSASGSRCAQTDIPDLFYVEAQEQNNVVCFLLGNTLNFQTSGNYPEESTQHSEHGKSFKSRTQNNVPSRHPNNCQYTQTQNLEHSHCAHNVTIYNQNIKGLINKTEELLIVISMEQIPS
jgi:hypothetical protein